MKNHNFKLKLLLTASAAAISFGSNASALPNGTPSWPMLPTVFNQVITQDFDLTDELDITARNRADVLGATGAELSNIDQIATSSFRTISLRIPGGFLLSANQDIVTGGNDLDMLEIRSTNFAGAATTIGDALAGGSQRAGVTLNSFAAEVANNLSLPWEQTNLEGEDGWDTPGLTVLDLSQQVFGFGTEEEYGFDFGLQASNSLHALVLGGAQGNGGNAIIDGLIANPDFGQVEDAPEYLRSLQQAAVSLNTVGVTAENGTDVGIALAQLFNSESLISGEDDNGDFRFDVTNVAAAYSPRPDPLAEVPDPAVIGIDQIASVSLNTVTLGNLAVPEDAGVEWEELDVATFEILGGQEVDFDWNLLPNLRNLTVATTSPELYAAAYYTTDDARLQFDQDLFGEGEDALLDLIFDYAGDDFGRGDVTITDGSQNILLKVNTLSHQGLGSVALYGADDEYDFHQLAAYVTFDDDYDILHASWNTAFAVTRLGDVEVAEYSQYARIDFNTISVGGDLLGVYEADLGLLLEEEAPVGIRQNALDIEFAPDYVNHLDAYTEIGDVTAANVAQVGILNLNTVSAGAALQATLLQGAVDIDADLDNRFYASTSEGNTAVTGLSQALSMQLNTVSAGASLGGVIAQYADDIDINLTNQAVALSDFGSASINGLTQQAINRVNTISLNTLSTAPTVSTGTPSINTEPPV